MKQISSMLILVSILDFFYIIIAVLDAHVDNTTEQQVHVTEFENNSSASLNLFRNAEIKNEIENFEKELGGINFNHLIKKVDHKKVQYFFEDEEKNSNLNKLIFYKNYESLCLGNLSLTTKMQSKLKCRYVDRGIPFLKIAPFKEEEAYLEPRIVIFHDVLSEEEIETMKRLAQPKMHKAYFIDEKSKESVTLDIRITDTAWLERDDHKQVDNVYLRAQLMTGLSMINAEALQVAYYPLRGKYEPHYDFSSLNNVEEGGTTVFSKLHVSLTPRTGSAAFWYNLKPNGFREYLTLHAACPVTSGSKWAANLWISEEGQEFHRPCTLDYQPRDEDWERVSIIPEYEEMFQANETSDSSN